LCIPNPSLPPHFHFTNMGSSLSAEWTDDNLATPPNATTARDHDQGAAETPGARPYPLGYDCGFHRNGKGKPR
jgi:hypothetical protein